MRGRLGLRGYADALRGIHRPVDEADVHRARARLKWDEAFALQVLLAQRRLAAASYSAIPRPPVDGGLLAEFDAALPFELTVGQRAGRRTSSPPTWRASTRCTGCCRARSAPARP